MNKGIASRGVRIFRVFNGIFLSFLALVCFLPLLHVAAVSLSSAASASANKVLFWPIGINASAYRLIFSNAAFIRAFFMSVARTLSGTLLNLVMVVLASYPLSKDKGKLFGRNVLAWFFILPMLISGGLIPTFLVNRSLGLTDNFLVLILPGCVPTFYVILMMNFFRGISPSLWESAALDGASEFTILTRIMLPLSMASLATIALFSSVDHWNEWFSALIYMNDRNKWPLQTLLRQMQQSIDVSVFSSDDVLIMKQLSSRSFQAAQIMFATVPILMVYPFMQRYFISGVTIGAVKE